MWMYAGLWLVLRRTSCTCAGLKEHEKALTMFLFALTAPTMVVNAITMAAFRKHVLVSLIHSGMVLTRLQPHRSFERDL